MKITIGDKKHKIIYIEYHDKLPHSVVTIVYIKNKKNSYWSPRYWDFFLEEGDRKDIRAYNSGSGGDATKIEAPHWVDGYIGTYWIADGISFNGTPINAKKLEQPERLIGYLGKKSRNPFKVAEITDNCEYCDRCGHESSNFCYEHKYDDDDGNVRYKDDNSYE